MKWIAYDSVTKEVVCTGESPEGASFDDFPEHLTVVTDTTGVPGKSYWNGTSVVDVPAAPTPHHNWDWATKTWVSNLAEAKESKKNAVSTLRKAHNYLPISYSSSVFDADETAQRNVSAWQTQLAAGTDLPPGFVWRDYNNVDHPADAAFINGLGTAITLRGTVLYQVAWVHKAAIDALSSIEDVLAYDITAGWPA